MKRKTIHYLKKIIGLLALVIVSFKINTTVNSFLFIIILLSLTDIGEPFEGTYNKTLYELRGLNEIYSRNDKRKNI